MFLSFSILFQDRKKKDNGNINAFRDRDIVIKINMFVE
jgi:hypothetical protein